MRGPSSHLTWNDQYIYIYIYIIYIMHYMNQGILLLGDITFFYANCPYKIHRCSSQLRGKSKSVISMFEIGET